MTSSIPPITITHATNDVLIADDGREFVDLFSANGTAWLGHGNPVVRAALAAQLERVWTTGALPTDARRAAERALAGFLPSSHRVAGFYSTGMEAAEFAIRFARVTTGRTGVIGFSRSLHGKSLATAFLGWDNRDGVELPGFSRLPFVPCASEAEILARLETVLANRTISAMFVEPIQSSGGGHFASPAFYDRAAELCRQHGTLVVFDEIVTGFHRTGPRFFFSDLATTPDVVLLGKGMGHGFPVSAAIVDARHPVTSAMLPGSTFAGNALAAAAVVATLGEMRRLDVTTRVTAIARTVTRHLGDLATYGCSLRGRGALWVIETRGPAVATTIAERLAARGVLLGYAGALLRLLPAATIDPGRLDRACGTLREVVESVA